MIGIPLKHLALMSSKLRKVCQISDLYSIYFTTMYILSKLKSNHIYIIELVIILITLADATCVSFPGPGENHIYTFNPMREFIHNYEDHLDEAFYNFKKTHKKYYNNDMDHKYRKEIFRQNIR